MAKSDATIKAEALATMHRKGFYDPNSVSIENLASMMAVATSEQGRAKALINDLARDDSTPVVYQVTDSSVMLENGSEDHVEATIERFDAGRKPTDMTDLRIVK